MAMTSLSTECVLKFVSKNRRRELFDRCPQLRPVDRRVPLKLDYLSAEDTTIQIDSTTYKIGIVRQYPNNVNPPKLAIESNAKGGITTDDSGKVSVFEQDRAPSMEEKKAAEDAEKKLLELLPKLKEHNLDYIQKSLKTEVACLQKIVRSYKEQLAISQLEYTNYIQLTKIENGFVVHRERVLYQSPIQDAVEYIVDMLLRSRKIHTTPSNFIGTSLFNWPERLRVAVSTFNYELQFIDRNLVSIDFPTKNARFDRIYNVEFKSTSDTSRFKFEVKEKDLEQAILNILNITETPKAELAAVKEKIQSIESYDVSKSFKDHGSKFTIDKIQNGKLPSTGGEYTIVIEFNMIEIRENNIDEFGDYLDYLQPLPQLNHMNPPLFPPNLEFHPIFLP